MATSITFVAAGTTSTPAPLAQNQNLCAGSSVQGGTVVISVGPTSSGPFTAINSASGSAVSYRAPLVQWYTVTAAAQQAVAVVSDVNSSGEALSLQTPIDSPNSTSEVALFSLRVPPNVLPGNCRITLTGRVTVTNNVNVKTLIIRAGGIAGTSVFTSPSLASVANYNFNASLSGIGDGQTLKGYGSGTTGGFGTSTTAYTTLSTAYTTTETELVVTATKATGTDTMKLDSLVVTLA